MTSNTSKLASYSAGSGQFYTQQNDSLYWLSSYATGDTLNSFNFGTANQDDSFDVTVGTSLGGFSCLASSDSILLVSGGYASGAYLDTLRIYDLIANEWLAVGPVMPQRRGGHACAVRGNQLYVLGGIISKNPFIATDSIAYIEVDGAIHNSSEWAELGETMSTPAVRIESRRGREYDHHSRRSNE